MVKARWKESFDVFFDYVDKHKGKYPKSDEVYLYYNIGGWMNRQRVIYNNGNTQEDGSIIYKSYTLTKEQIDMLNEMKFVWKVDIKKVYREAWDKNFNLVKKYRNTHNKLPWNITDYKGVNIHSWMNKQETIYNNGEPQEDGSIIYNGHILEEYQIDKLNEINFFDKKEEKYNDICWNVMFNLLCEYLKKNNNEYPSQSTYYKKKALGTWVNKQRVIYNNGIPQEDGSIIYHGETLSKHRIDKLDSINFVWVPLTKRECHSEIKNEKKEKLIKRKVLYRQKKVLEQSKKEIESMEDIKIIEKKFIKQLNLFN